VGGLQYNRPPYLVVYKYTEADAMKKKKILKAIEELHNPIDHIYKKITCKECGQEYPCRTSNLLNKKKEKK